MPSPLRQRLLGGTRSHDLRLGVDDTDTYPGLLGWHVGGGHLDPAAPASLQPCRCGLLRIRPAASSHESHCSGQCRPRGRRSRQWLVAVSVVSDHLTHDQDFGLQVTRDVDDQFDGGEVVRRLRPARTLTPGTRRVLAPGAPPCRYLEIPVPIAHPVEAPSSPRAGLGISIR